MFKKVLLAVDGSKNALRAAEKAGHIASLEKSIVTILYCSRCRLIKIRGFV